MVSPYTLSDISLAFERVVMSFPLVPGALSADTLCEDDSSDLVGASSSMWKDIARKECKMSIVQNRPLLSGRKGQNIFLGM